MSARVRVAHLRMFLIATGLIRFENVFLAKSFFQGNGPIP